METNFNRMSGDKHTKPAALWVQQNNLLLKIHLNTSAEEWINSGSTDVGTVLLALFFLEDGLMFKFCVWLKQIKAKFLKLNESDFFQPLTHGCPSKRRLL